MSTGEERVPVHERAVPWINVLIVRSALCQAHVTQRGREDVHVVAHVRLRARADRCEPQHVDAKRMDVVELGCDACEVAPATAGRVLE
jgi:hypothetical protein